MSSIATLTLIHSPSLVRAYEICECVCVFVSKCLLLLEIKSKWIVPERFASGAVKRKCSFTRSEGDHFVEMCGLAKESAAESKIRNRNIVRVRSSANEWLEQLQRPCVNHSEAFTKRLSSTHKAMCKPTGPFRVRAPQQATCDEINVLKSRL